MGFFWGIRKEVIMKQSAKIAAGAIMNLFVLLSVSTVSAEQNIIGELAISPKAASREQNIMKELSTPRYAVAAKQKKAEELAIIASYALIDYSQSVTMFYKMDGYQEINPILGPKPSRASLFAFCVLGTGLFSIIADNLSDPWRQIFVDSVIATEQFNIEDNRRVYPGWNTDGPPVHGRLVNSVPIIISLRF
jgi:hypothetical protein